MDKSYKRGNYYEICASVAVSEKNLTQPHLNTNTVSDTLRHTKCGIIQWAKVYIQPRDDESFFQVCLSCCQMAPAILKIPMTMEIKITECGRFVIVNLQSGP